MSLSLQTCHCEGLYVYFNFWNSLLELHSEHASYSFFFYG